MCNYTPILFHHFPHKTYCSIGYSHSIPIDYSDLHCNLHHLEIVQISFLSFWLCRFVENTIALLLKNFHYWIHDYWILSRILWLQTWKRSLNHAEKCRSNCETVWNIFLPWIPSIIRNAKYLFWFHCDKSDGLSYQVHLSLLLAFSKWRLVSEFKR